MKKTVTIQLSNGAEVEVEYRIEPEDKGDLTTAPSPAYAVWYKASVKTKRGELVEIPQEILQGLKLEDEITESINHEFEEGRI